MVGDWDGSRVRRSVRRLRTIPGTSNTAGAIARGAAVGTSQAVASMASSTRARDEMKLEYTMQTTDNAVRVPKTTHEAKAQANGEDLVTPVVEKAATQIADVLLKTAR